MSSRSCSEGELLKNSAVKFALLDQKRGGLDGGIEVAEKCNVIHCFWSTNLSGGQGQVKLGFIFIRF